MKKTMLTTAALLAAAAAQAQTAPPVGWSLTGKIQPPPCTITLTNGRADFGTFSKADVKKWPALTSPARYRSPTPKLVDMNVVCLSGHRMALSAVDNRASTVVGPAGETHGFGLGVYAAAEGDTNIGRFLIQYDALQVRQFSNSIPYNPFGTLVGPLNPVGGSWSVATANEKMYMPSGKSFGYLISSSATPRPDPLIQIIGKLKIFVEPLQSVVDTAVDNINFNGGATITLVTL